MLMLNTTAILPPKFVPAIQIQPMLMLNKVKPPCCRLHKKHSNTTYVNVKPKGNTAIQAAAKDSNTTYVNVKRIKEHKNL